MAAAGAAIGMHSLPDGVLQLVFSKLSFAERLRLSSVCKQWHAVSLAPALLTRVAIKAHSQGMHWSSLDMLHSVCSWLARRAAGGVQDLTLEIDTQDCWVRDSDFDEEEEWGADAAAPLVAAARFEGAAALIEGTLATAGSSLRRLALVLGSDISLHLGAWTAALTSLQALSVSGEHCKISVSGNLRGLTALHTLSLCNSLVEFAPNARLPLSITALDLESRDDMEPLPQQLARLTRLHTLHLSSLCDSDDYKPLLAHSSTLQSLSLHNCNSLPKCLPRMLALRTLVITEGLGLTGNVGLFDGEEMWHDTRMLNACILRKTLRTLPSLEHLTVDPRDPMPPPAVLPRGPWQHTVQHLEASADLLQASLPALGAVPHLETLGIGRACMQDQQPAVEVLRWVAEEAAAPPGCLLLYLSDELPPPDALSDAIALVEARHPGIDVFYSGIDD